MLEENMSAPDFNLMGSDGREHRLSDLKGQLVVLYFYPKDNTPGCTKEACDFRDNIQTLTAKNCVTLGISRDSAESHTRFKEKYALNFLLLSDPELIVHEAYHALDGTKTIRSTFLIDEVGKITKIWPKVSVTGHVEEILQTIEASALS